MNILKVVKRWEKHPSLRSLSTRGLSANYLLAMYVFGNSQTQQSASHLPLLGKYHNKNMFYIQICANTLDWEMNQA